MGLLPHLLTLWVCKLLMLICILTKNVITSCSVTMMLFLHLEVKPLMTLTTVLYLSCALISGFESSLVPTTLPTAYDVYPLDGRHDGGYYTVKDCVTIDVLPRTPGNNVYVGFMVWSNFTATKCRGLVSLN